MSFIVAPSSPGMPEVKKVGKNYIELAWSPPTNDGGAKVTGYIVEKKPVGTEQWTKAAPYMSRWIKFGILYSLEFD